jgi:hypothetical protein
VPIEHILTLATALKGHLLATCANIKEPAEAQPRARKKQKGGGGAVTEKGGKAKRGGKKAAAGD